MHVVRTPASARAIARTLPRPVGFVPTMGALHAGHLALVDRARRENAVVAVSIFVNPLQFGPGEDFERYPRDFARDAALLDERGVELLYAPATGQMYGPGFATHVDVGPLAIRFEGAARPGHFAGVATVVTKLLNAIEPTTLYLGQKDAQQTAVLRRALADLDVPVDVVVCPTVREADGLARSSRNAYLSPDERAAAPSLHGALVAVEQKIVAGSTTDPAVVLAAGRALLVPPLVWEYLSVVDPATFEPLQRLGQPALVIGVARAGRVRLLDNVSVARIDGTDPLVTPERRRPWAART
jgi:pantoate--beta-alanine ligase